MADEIDVLRALAHPVRWGILERLAAEPGICACSFTEYFDVSQPTISAHLKALRQAGLVTTQRRGTEIWYSLARDQLAPLAGRLSGIASPGVPVAQDRAPEVQAPVVPATVVPAKVPQATVPYAAARRGRPPAPVPAADARSPGRLADVVAAAARMSGSLAGLPPPPARASGGLAAAAAAAQAAAQAARRPSGDEGAARPAVPERSRGLADMAAMAQAALPRGAERRGRTAAPPARLRGGRASVPAQAGSAED
jgi:ArsR family transcriptional regulator, arsenate/arsenite/antimonite-responsive transcriptional repressor